MFPTRVRVLTLIAFATLTVPAAAQRKPITHEDLWLLPRVGAPALSPDGAWAVFSVTEPSYKSNETVNDLWIVATNGSAPARRLTSTRSGESGVAWSPDSRRIAFSARREHDDVAQIYMLDLSGGDATRVTSLSTGARSPRWRPDGRALLFTSSVYPKEPATRKANVRVYDSFPIRRWDRWLDDKQAHLFVQSLETGATPRDLLAGTRLVAAPGYSGVAGNSDDELQAAWSPDGSSIVFVAGTGRDSIAFAAPGLRLYRIDVNGGEPQPITRAADSYFDPQFSPDGKRLYARTEDSGSQYNHARLVMMDWPTVSAPTGLTDAFDRSIDDYEFSPDGRTIYMQVGDAGRVRIYGMPATGGAVRPLVTEAAGVFGGVEVGGKSNAPVMVASWQSATKPPEIVRVDVANGSTRELTSFTRAKIAELDLPPLREFWFTSEKGRQIHNFVTLPPNFDESKKYPLLVIMHGGPHSAHTDSWGLRWHYHMLARPGYVVLLTNYTGSTGFSEEFARAIERDPLATPGAEINQAADEAIKRLPFIDASRQAAGGASYGGHLAYWLQATTTRYRALIAHAGAINMEAQWGTSDVIYHREVYFGGPVWEQGPVWREQNPIRFAARFKTPMLLTVGEKDYRVPMNNTLEAWAVMQRLQIPSRLLVFPDQNHWIMSGEDSRFFFNEVYAWLATYLGGVNPASTSTSDQ
ncbi:MAG: prolyl oligopeptidase family serine peptidase [Gemmatimonadota bacterium]